MSEKPGQMALDAWCAFHRIAPITIEKADSRQWKGAWAAVEAAVRADERERCARIADEEAAEYGSDTARTIAAAIRAAKE